MGSADGWWKWAYYTNSANYQVCTEWYPRDGHTLRITKLPFGAHWHHYCHRYSPIFESARFVWHFIELFCPWCSLQEPLSHRPFHHQYPRNRQHHVSCNRSYIVTTSVHSRRWLTGAGCGVLHVPILFASMWQQHIGRRRGGLTQFEKQMSNKWCRRNEMKTFNNQPAVSK